jgi:hypothetical protein
MLRVIMLSVVMLNVVAQLVERWTINLKFEGSNPGVLFSNQFSKDAKTSAGSKWCKEC